MRKLLIFAILLCFTLSLLVGCAREEDDEPAPRTYYESLALDTPETAVETFVDAFQRDDFETLYLIFHRTTQMSISQNINVINYQKLVKANDPVEADRIASDSAQYKMLDEWEHITGSYLFDSLMLAAKQHSAFLIDLSGEVSVLRTEENIGESVYTDVVTNVEGIDGEVRFRMEQAPSGRWRVYQVITLDGDEDQIPWSVPTEKE